MAIEINMKFKEENGQIVSSEPLVVTIALEEYRSLLQEVKRLEYENLKAFETIDFLQAEHQKLLNRGVCAAKMDGGKNE